MSSTSRMTSSCKSWAPLKRSAERLWRRSGREARLDKVGARVAQDTRETQLGNAQCNIKKRGRHSQSIRIKTQTTKHLTQDVAAMILDTDTTWTQAITSMTEAPTEAIKRTITTRGKEKLVTRSSTMILTIADRETLTVTRRMSIAITSTIQTPTWTATRE